MPDSAQLLYFHLGLRADDDGIVEAYPITQMLGTAPDNLKVLISKGFLKQLNVDQVVFITDWLEHNKIRPDRKTDSIYKHLIPKSIPLLEAKPRADTGKITGKGTMDDHWTTNGQHKLSKDKLSKDKIDKETEQSSVFSMEEYLKKMEKDSKRPIQIIAYFFRYKKLKFENLKEVQAAIKRHLRASKELEGFHGSKVTKAMDVCNKKYNDISWTLETVLKELTK